MYDHLHAESLSGWLDEDSAGDADDDDGDEGDGESCKEFDHVINHHYTKNTNMMIIIFIMITITWDGGSEENPDDDEYPSVVAKAVLAVCFDPSRTVDIDMILMMMMTGMILMSIFVCL